MSVEERRDDWERRLERLRREAASGPLGYHERAAITDPKSTGRCPICGGLNPGDITHVRCM